MQFNKLFICLIKISQILSMTSIIFRDEIIFIDIKNNELYIDNGNNSKYPSA